MFGANTDYVSEKNPDSLLSWYVTIHVVYIIIVCTLVLVAHNGFAFDFPILLAEVERRPELDLFNFRTGNVHFSDTLCCYIYKINDLLEFFYFCLDEEGWGRHSPGDITWDGETPFENSWECRRRHVANTNTKQQSYTIE